MTKEKKLTDIGFKRYINKKYPLTWKYHRAFVKCKKCKTQSWYDYVPFSLSNPIMTTTCGHSFKDDYIDF